MDVGAWCPWIPLPACLLIRTPKVPISGHFNPKMALLGKKPTLDLLWWPLVVLWCSLVVWSGCGLLQWQLCYLLVGHLPVLDHLVALGVEIGRETPIFIGRSRPFSLSGDPGVGGGWPYDSSFCALGNGLQCGTH